ncbi:MAG: DUF4345 domain-containing protein [Pseudomonadota bacterium]
MTRVLLAGSGALLGVIGGAMLTSTQAFLQTSGVEISSDPSLLSELKAPSVLLIVAAMVMIAGSARTRFANTALILGGVVYGSYGLARLLGMAMNGMPSDPLIVATAIELALSALLLGRRLYAATPAQSSRLQAQHV